MNPMLQQLAQQLMSGAFQGSPAMANFNRMMAGKNPQEQFKTLLNAAKSRGLDVDAKIFTKEDLQAFGLNDSPQG